MPEAVRDKAILYVFRFRDKGIIHLRCSANKIRVHPRT